MTITCALCLCCLICFPNNLCRNAEEALNHARTPRVDTTFNIFVHLESILMKLQLHFKMIWVKLTVVIIKQLCGR